MENKLSNIQEEINYLETFIKYSKMDEKRNKLDIIFYGIVPVAAIYFSVTQLSSEFSTPHNTNLVCLLTPLSMFSGLQCIRYSLQTVREASNSLLNNREETHNLEIELKNLKLKADAQNTKENLESKL